MASKKVAKRNTCGWATALKQEQQTDKKDPTLNDALLPSPQAPTATGPGGDPPIPQCPIGLPTEIWHIIAQHLPWQHALHLSNSCTFLDFLRHALDIQLSSLLTPEKIASGLLAHRKQERSKHIAKLIMKDGMKNERAMTLELEAGLDVFRQWWAYEPYDRTPGRQHRQSPATRHSELGYAVMRSHKLGLRRYWRFRKVTRSSAIKAAYLDALVQESQAMLVDLMIGNCFAT